MTDIKITTEPANDATDPINGLDEGDIKELTEEHAVSPELIRQLCTEGRLTTWARGQMLRWASPDGRTADVFRVRPADRRDDDKWKVEWPKGKTTHVNAVRWTGVKNVIVVEGFCQSLAIASWAPEGFDIVGMNGSDGIHDNIPQPWAEGKNIWLYLDADRNTNERVAGAVGRVTSVLAKNGAETVRLGDLGGFETDGADDVLNEVRSERRTAVLSRSLDRASWQHGGDANAPFTVDGLSFLAVDEPDEPPLWGDADKAALWSSGESLFIFGPPGSAKSTLTHLIVFARLGLLVDVLGFPVTDDGRKVLYLAMDRPKQIQRAMRRLVRAVPSDKHHVLAERLEVRRGPLDYVLTDKRNRDVLRDYCLRHGIGTVVVDSIKDVLPDASKEEPAGDYNSARQSCLAAGIEWIELHHNRKANGANQQPNTLEDVYGSRWLTAGAGSVISLWQDNPGSDTVSLRHIRASGEKLRDLTLSLDIHAGTLTYETARTLEEFLHNQQHGDFAAADAARWLNRPASQIRTRLDRMVDRGELRKFNSMGNTNRVMYGPVRDEDDA
ncbi:AAA family ATPase [Streptomyces griseorubiginosus]|uniref:AAA family ATPase n=1 Tax=Streptomyces griseorubiginosus TaxID=67304 RepID=UPI00076CD46F|nr:AAA family ATPase [Streptomyces griseorubiginosus]KUM69256.1 hypothetical protein AQI84_34585 [Streptomyces griseorubiginosus]